MLSSAGVIGSMALFKEINSALTADDTQNQNILKTIFQDLASIEVDKVTSTDQRPFVYGGIGLGLVMTIICIRMFCCCCPSSKTLENPFNYDDKPECVKIDPATEQKKEEEKKEEKKQEEDITTV